jgi:hypothetical protein
MATLLHLPRRRHSAIAKRLLSDHGSIRELLLDIEVRRVVIGVAHEVSLTLRLLILIDPLFHLREICRAAIAVKILVTNGLSCLDDGAKLRDRLTQWVAVFLGCSIGVFVCRSGGGAIFATSASVLNVKDWLLHRKELFVLLAFVHLGAFFVDSELDIWLDLGNDSEGVLKTDRHAVFGRFVSQEFDILNRVVFREFGCFAVLYDFVVIAV